ncbi:MAG: cupredoxin family copper-binding protein [Candidatus Woesearchaeota archaeon]
MKKLFVLIALLAILVACAPEQPVQPQVQVEPQAQFRVNPPEQKVEAVEPPARVGTAPSEPKTVNVDIVNFAYVPASVKIRVGDTVTWKQVDRIKHTVTIVSGPESFDSGLLSAGQTFSHTFTKPGTYVYKCTPHPRMTGEIVVE